MSIIAPAKGIPLSTQPQLGTSLGWKSITGHLRLAGPAACGTMRRDLRPHPAWWGRSAPGLMGAGGREHRLTPQGVRPRSNVMGSTDGDPQLPHCWSITHRDPSVGIQVTPVGGGGRVIAGESRGHQEAAGYWPCSWGHECQDRARVPQEEDRSSRVWGNTAHTVPPAPRGWTGRGDAGTGLRNCLWAPLACGAGQALLAKERAWVPMSQTQTPETSWKRW